MRAKATKAQAAQSMLKRAERLMEGVEGERRADRVARIKFPAPAPCGKTPLTAAELSKSYGSLEVFTDVDLAIDKGSRVVILGLNGAGKTTLLRILGGIDRPDTGRVNPGHGLKLGYYAQEHETLDTSADRAGEHAARGTRSSPTPRPAACSGRSCSAATTRRSRRRCSPAARRPGSRWPSWWCPAPTCCCSTSRRTTWTPPPARRCSNAIRTYQGAIILVTHDEGAVDRAGARPGADPARRRRGPLERGLRRPRRARLRPVVGGAGPLQSPHGQQRGPRGPGARRPDVRGERPGRDDHPEPPGDEELPDPRHLARAAHHRRLARPGRAGRRRAGQPATRSPPGSTAGCSAPRACRARPR